jgi:TetR/AcrR family transcriptional repressor of bet genes
MGRKRIDEIRRAELVEAAFAVMKQGGVGAASLARVAAEAGLSKGMVLHYFENREALIEATLRHVNALYGHAVAERLAAAKTPLARVEAIVEANFAPWYYRPEIAHTWLSFCAEAPFKQQPRRLQRVLHQRMQSNFTANLKPLVGPGRARSIALGLTSLIDGLWVRCALTPGGFDREVARRQVLDYLAVSLGSPRKRGQALSALREGAGVRGVGR